jgi:enoyl-CoA hydratase/carnithine racemase
LTPFAPDRCKTPVSQRAAHYAMLCEPMPGTVAGQLGIASFVVPENEVEATALKFVQDLSAGPTRSYAAIRALLKAWSGGGVPSADAVILDITMGLHSSEDARRGTHCKSRGHQKGNRAAEDCLHRPMIESTDNIGALDCSP